MRTADLVTIVPSIAVIIVSLHVPESVDARYVVTLRRVVPELPPIPTGILFSKLRRSRLVVLGRFSEERALQIESQGRAANLCITGRSSTLFDRELVLETLRPEPLSESPRPVIEAVFHPAFAPELVVRIAGSELTALVPSACIDRRLCEPEPWWEPPHDAPSRPTLERYCERACISPAEDLFATMRAALNEHDDVGTDGIVVQLRSIDESDTTLNLCTWSPGPTKQPNRYALTTRILMLADDALADARVSSAVIRALDHFALPQSEEIIHERHLITDMFRCCGDADLRPFRCRRCGHLMVLCEECDTLYPDLRDPGCQQAWPGPCPSCGASTEVAHDASHCSRRSAWRRAGLEHLLRAFSGESDGRN